MEDKELQELFDAKRTVEANRHRQEELRRLVTARATKRNKKRKTMMLWPVWTGAAAAAVALMLIIRPLLMEHDNVEFPMLVAQSDTHTVLPATPTCTEESISASESRKERKASPERKKNTMTEATENKETETTNSIDTVSTTNPTGTISTISTIDTISIPSIDSPAPERRVLRRQSTLLACTEGCKTPEGNSEKSSRNVQVNLIPNDQYADATIHTFVINK